MTEGGAIVSICRNYLQVHCETFASVGKDLQGDIDHNLSLVQFLHECCDRSFQMNGSESVNS